MKRTNYKYFAALLLFFCLISPSHAHKVNVFAFIEGKSVFVEAYFVDGKRAKNSTVTVMDATGQVISEGETNDEGQYEFQVEQAGDIRIAVNAGMGHMADYTLPASDFGGQSAAVSSSETSPSPVDISSAGGNLSQSELNALLSRPWPRPCAR